MQDQLDQEILESRRLRSQAALADADVERLRRDLTNEQYERERALQELRRVKSLASTLDTDTHKLFSVDLHDASRALTDIGQSVHVIKERTVGDGRSDGQSHMNYMKTVNFNVPKTAKMTGVDRVVSAAESLLSGDLPKTVTTSASSSTYTFSFAANATKNQDLTCDHNFVPSRGALLSTLLASNHAQDQSFPTFTVSQAAQSIISQTPDVSLNLRTHSDTYSKKGNKNVIAKFEYPSFTDFSRSRTVEDVGFKTSGSSQLTSAITAAETVASRGTVHSAETIQKKFEEIERKLGSFGSISSPNLSGGVADQRLRRHSSLENEVRTESSSRRIALATEGNIGSISRLSNNATGRRQNFEVNIEPKGLTQSSQARDKSWTTAFGSNSINKSFPPSGFASTTSTQSGGDDHDHSSKATPVESITTSEVSIAAPPGRSVDAPARSNDPYSLSESSPYKYSSMASNSDSGRGDSVSQRTKSTITTTSVKNS